jgi:hypothetical protein
MPSPVGRRPWKPLWVAIALAFLFEAWLWDRLRPVVAAVVNVTPWRRLKQQLAQLVDRLPPWASLIVFVIPLIVLLPLKLIEVWFFVHQDWIGVVVTLVLAKLVGLGVTAFVFDVTRAKLLQIGWFRALYEKVMAWRVWAHALVDPIRQRARVYLRYLRRRARFLRSQRTGRWLRRLAALRRRHAGA